MRGSRASRSRSASTLWWVTPDDQVRLERGERVGGDGRGAVGIAAAHVAPVVVPEREAEQAHQVAGHPHGVPGQDLGKPGAVGQGAVGGEPLELRLLDAGDQRVAVQLELVVAEGGVVELGGVQRLDHLAAAVILAEEARAQHVAGQHEEDRALVGEAGPHRRDPRQSAGAVGERVGDVDVVDKKEANRIERLRRLGARQAGGARGEQQTQSPSMPSASQLLLTEPQAAHQVGAHQPQLGQHLPPRPVRAGIQHFQHRPVPPDGLLRARARERAQVLHPEPPELRDRGATDVQLVGDAHIERPRARPRRAGSGIPACRVATGARCRAGRTWAPGRPGRSARATGPNLSPIFRSSAGRLSGPASSSTWWRMPPTMVTWSQP